MLTSLKLYFCVLGISLVIDFLWVGLAANGFYVREFGEMGRITDGKFQVVYWAAIAVYILLALGTVALVLPRVAPGDGWSMAFAWGALFGFIVYGVYDMTNHATLKHWPLLLCAVDMAWGTFLSGTVAVAGKLLRDRWL